MTTKFNLFALAIVALVGFTFSSCSDDVPEPGKEIAFIEPYMVWDAGIEEVRAYMSKNLKGFKEDSEPEETSEGLQYEFEKGGIEYEYTFVDGKLRSSSVDYYITASGEFDSLKAQVTKKFGVTDWKEMPASKDLKWWTAKLPNVKNTDVAIGSAKSYMYVMFSYTLF